MTKEEFLLIISGFENEPFCIKTSAGWSDILMYRAVISDAVCTTSNGKPHMFRFSEIAELSFDLKRIPSNEKNDVDEIVSVCPNEKINCKSDNDSKNTSICKLLGDSEKIIQLYNFEVQKRRETIRDQVKGTPIEKQWSRVDSMLNDAVKNRALNYKKDEILALLDNLMDQYPCIELKQMKGIVYVKLEDYDTASYQFELAGDFQNAAAYAAMCGGDSTKYLFTIFSKWIRCDPDCDESVYSSFFATAYMLRYGKMCAKVIDVIDFENRSESIQNIIFYGLLRVLANYLPQDKIAISENMQRTEQISALAKKLESASAYESDEEYILPNLPHISDMAEVANIESTSLPVKNEETELDPDKMLIRNDDGSYCGYIIRYQKGYGFINKDFQATRGIFFHKMELEPFLAEKEPFIVGMYVKCQIIALVENGVTQNKAIQIEYWDDQSKKTDNYTNNFKPIVINEPTETTDDLDKMLLHNDDGSYCGYIIRYQKGYGFINKDSNASNGVYFHKKELDTFLSEKAPYIVGLYVKCNLTTVIHKGMKQDNAVRIEYLGDENKDITNAYNHSKSTEIEYEEVNESEIKATLRNASPSSVVQFYATHNKPYHALSALELSKDSFPYDKYVKHKIQLLQRTKSDDNELAKLLRFAINSSSDVSYKSHNLYFLGQVEYRLGRYEDVVETMKQFRNYSYLNKNSLQLADSVYLTAMAYYMLRDYSNSDKCANELLKLNQHTIEAQRLLERTVTLDNDSFMLLQAVDLDNLQFDMDVELTPFIDGLISDFSFGNISLKDVPADFDPWLVDGYTLDDAKKLESRLDKFSRTTSQRNNPNAFIAKAKLLNWMIQQMMDGNEKQEAEKQLRQAAYSALNIMSRRQLEKSNQEKRVYPFYCMQQYKMSAKESKKNIFSRFIMYHYLHNAQVNSSIKQISINNPPNDDDYGDVIIDLIIFRNMMGDECKEEIEQFCCIIEKRLDANQYRDVLEGITNCFKDCGNEDNMLQLFLRCSDHFNKWLDDFRSDVRTLVRSEQWEELLVKLGNYVEFPYLLERETEFIKQFIRVVDEMNSITQNINITPQERSLMNCKIIIKQMQDDMKSKPTYILYSVFFDVIGIIHNNAITKLGEITSHSPNIVPIGITQINVGLSNDKRFRLPLELENCPPAVQASKMRVKIKSMSDGIEIVNLDEQSKNIAEGTRFSHVLIFSVNSEEMTQAEIVIQVDYVYSVYNVMKQNYETHDGKNEIKYTVSFEDVLPIANNYSNYAKQQVVTDSSMFFGRKEVIDTLFDSICVVGDDGTKHLKGGNGIVIYGQRRSGKSSIMYHLKKKIQSEINRSIIVDFGSLRRVLVENTVSKTETNQMLEEELQNQNAEMTLGNMYYTITSGIQDYIDYEKYTNPDIMELSKKIEEYTGGKPDMLFPDKSNFESSSANIQLNFNDFLRKFKHIANVDNPAYGFRVVIMIDEFTYFNKAIENHFLPDSFMENWKALVSDSFMTMIVAGQDNMVEFIDRYVNEFSSFRTMWITFLKKDDAYDMVTEPINKNGERITPDAAHKLCRFTAGSPFLLMDVCSQLVDWMNRTRIVKLSSSLPDDFLTGAYMTAYEFKEDLLEPQYKDAGRLEWTNKIKLVLGLISRGTSKKVLSDQIPWDEFDAYAEILPNMLLDQGISEEQMKDILERLEKRQVIEKETGTINRYRITIPLCREWILRRGGEVYGNAE